MWQLLKCCVCSFSHLGPNTKIDNTAFFFRFTEGFNGRKKKKRVLFSHAWHCIWNWQHLWVFHHKGLVLEMFPPEDLTSSCKYPEHGTAAVQVALFCGGETWKKPCFCIKLPEHKAYCYSCELTRNCSYRNHITVAPWIYEVADIRTHFEKIHIFFIPYSLYRNNCQHN